MVVLLAYSLGRSRIQQTDAYYPHSDTESRNVGLRWSQMSVCGQTCCEDKEGAHAGITRRASCHQTLELYELHHTAD